MHPEAENTFPDNMGKEARYQWCMQSIEGIIDGENDLIANLANISAILKSAFQWWWIGFYLVKSGELVLGPFQGPVACTRISRGMGVCGTSWEQRTSIVVPDVNTFPNHIACSSLSKSEIVVPIMLSGEVVGVLDVDSEQPAHFNDEDEKWLSKLCDVISPIFEISQT